MKTFNQLLTETLDKEDLTDALEALLKDPDNEVAQERIQEIQNTHHNSSEINKIIADWERGHADNPKAVSRLKRIARRSNDKIKHMLLAPLQILMARGYQGTTA